MTVFVNGAFVAGDGAIAADDRAFLVGDGVFETLRLINAAPIFLEAHLARLRRGLGVLGIPGPDGLGELRATLAALAERNGASDGAAAARITISSGSGPRGLAPPRAPSPNLVLSVGAYAPRTSPALIALTKRRRLSTASTTSFKAIGAYAENILAETDAAAAGAEHGVLLNEHDRIACASAANIFIVTADGALVTPALSEGAMPGIVRAVVLAEARYLEIPTEETTIEPDQLMTGEVFLTNSLIGLRPARLHGSPDHPPSDIFRTLKACYERRVEASAGATH